MVYHALVKLAFRFVPRARFHGIRPFAIWLDWWIVSPGHRGQTAGWDRASVLLFPAAKV